MKSGWGIFFGIPFTLLFRPDMTQARADFIWLPTEMRPRPDSWPPSTRQRTKMWVAQPAAAEAESQWRRGLVLSQRLPPFKDAFGFTLRLKHSTRSPVRRSAVVAALHAMGDTRTGGGDKRHRSSPRACATLSFTAASVSATCKRVNGEPFVIQKI